MKKLYNAPQLECIVLSMVDVVATSGIGIGNDDETTIKFGSIQSIRNRV